MLLSLLPFSLLCTFKIVSFWSYAVSVQASFIKTSIFHIFAEGMVLLVTLLFWMRKDCAGGKKFGCFLLNRIKIWKNKDAIFDDMSICLSRRMTGLFLQVHTATFLLNSWKAVCISCYGSCGFQVKETSFADNTFCSKFHYFLFHLWCPLLKELGGGGEVWAIFGTMFSCYVCTRVTDVGCQPLPKDTAHRLAPVCRFIGSGLGIWGIGWGRVGGVGCWYSLYGIVETNGGF